MNDQFNSNSEPIEDWEISMSELTAEEKDHLLDAIKPASTVNSAPEQAALKFGSRQAATGTTEDWGMTNPLEKPSAPPEQTGWQLPAPIFRSSEGYTPKKFAPEKTIGQAIVNDGNSPVAADGNAAAVADFSELPAPPLSLKPPAPVAVSAPPAAKIEPQPDIIEEFPAPAMSAAPVSVKPKSTVWRIVSIVFGLLLMLGFIVGFLVLIYFLFFHKAVAE